MPSTQISFDIIGKEEAERIGNVLEAAFESDFIPVAVFENPGKPGWTVDVYFDGDQLETRGDAVASALRDAGIDTPFTAKVLPDADWVTQALEGLGAVRAGRFVVHGQHARSAVRSTDIGLLIEASRAFGTGHHATTAGCLEAIDWLQARQTIVNALDVGTGTAVLAIALAKTARCPVLATDIDPVSVRIASENVALNDVAPWVQCKVAAGFADPAIRDRAYYDLIVANILAGPLIGLAPDMARHLSDDGTIILSGLLVRQERAVLARYRAEGLVLRRRTRTQGWSTLMLSRQI